MSDSRCARRVREIVLTHCALAHTEGGRTPQVAITSEKTATPPAGFEPATNCLEGSAGRDCQTRGKIIFRFIKPSSFHLTRLLTNSLALHRTSRCARGVRAAHVWFLSLVVVALAGTILFVGPVGTAPGAAAPCEHPAYPKINDAHKRWVHGLYRNPWLPKKAVAKHTRLYRCAPSDAQRRAMAKRWTVAKREVPVDNWQTWLAVGRCEQPGPGRWGIWWSFNGGTYSGGLGFFNQSWLAFRPKGAPFAAGDASWRQQMQAANNLLNSVGWGWGCSG